MITAFDVGSRVYKVTPCFTGGVKEATVSRIEVSVSKDGASIITKYILLDNYVAGCEHYDTAEESMLFCDHVEALSFFEKELKRLVKEKLTKTYDTLHKRLNPCPTTSAGE